MIIYSDLIIDIQNIINFFWFSWIWLLRISSTISEVSKDVSTDNLSSPTQRWCFRGGPRDDTLHRPLLCCGLILGFQDGVVVCLGAKRGLVRKANLFTYCRLWNMCKQARFQIVVFWHMFCSQRLRQDPILVFCGLCSTRYVWEKYLLPVPVLHHSILFLKMFCFPLCQKGLGRS